MRKTKTLWKILLAGIGAVGFATTSWASVGVTSVTNGDVKVAAELVTALVGPTIDLGQPGTWPGNGGPARELVYAPNIDVTTDSTIKFDFVNFAVVATPENKYYLRIQGAADDNPAGSTWQVATLVDFSSDADGNYASMTFKVVNHDANGDAFVDPNVDDRIGASQSVVMSSDATTAVAPVIKVKKGLTVGAIGTMSVPTVKDATGVSKEAPTAPAQVTVFTLVPGLTAHVTNPTKAPDSTPNSWATSVIDVNAGTSARKVFVPEGLGTDTPSLTESVADILVTNNAEYGFALDGNDSWTLVLKRSNVDGVSGVTIGGDAMTAGVNQWSLTGTFDVENTPLTTPQALDIHANGTTILRDGTWTVDLVVNTNDIAVPNNVLTLLSGVTSHVWTTNGAQFSIPYFHNNTTSYGTSMVITNRFASDAGIQMDIWTDTGAVANGVSLGVLAGHETTLITAQQIQLAAETAIPSLSKSNGNHRYMAIFTVNAPADTITAAAFQNDPSGAKRSLPVQFTNAADAIAPWVQ